MTTARPGRDALRIPQRDCFLPFLDLASNQNISVLEFNFGASNLDLIAFDEADLVLCQKPGRTNVHVYSLLVGLETQMCARLTL